MRESDVKVANIQVNDPSHADMDVINGIYLIENNSMIQVKKEIQDLEEETSSKRGCTLPNFILNSERKIKEEIHDQDDDHIYIKDEPLTITKEDSTVASCLESANINEGRCKDIKSCYKNLKRKKTKIQADLPMRGQEKTSKAVNYDIMSHHLPKIVSPSNDIHNRLAHEHLTPGGSSVLQPDSSKVKHEETFSDLFEEKTSSALTTQDFSPSTKTKDGLKKCHFCPTCHKEFTRKNSLVNHLVVHLREETFTCDFCKKTFTKKSILVDHLKIHMGEKPFECSVCSKRFSVSSTLRRHSLIHSGDWPYKCQVCSKGFGQESQLKDHERIHTGEKPYKCSACPKSFSQTSNLKKHELTHTGERQYRCSVCSKEFIWNSDLKIHKRIHAGEKPYKCSVCSKEFIRNCDLKIHERIHTGEKPYKCSVCSKEFIRNSYLKIHERIHTGERPYKCSMCLKEFIRNFDLKIHERIHTGEKPHKCSLCPKEFVSNSELRQHERIHPPEHFL